MARAPPERKLPYAVSRRTPPLWAASPAEANAPEKLRIEAIKMLSATRLASSGRARPRINRLTQIPAPARSGRCRGCVAAGLVES